MAIFISYSHNDKKFVDELSAHLVKNGARVWIDRWELKVGDSIIQRIQAAIKEADALIVILSKASVDSEWCKKELSAGLVRELEEKRVVILPVLLEDCEIPLFLKEKLYADFRYDFEEGLRTTLEAIAGVTSDTLGQIKKQEYYFDFGIDWNFDSDLYHLRITLLERYEEYNYSVITEINAEANKAATGRYIEWAKRGLDWYARLVVMSMIASIEPKTERYLYLEDNSPKSRNYRIKDDKLGIEYNVHVTSRRIGMDTGKDVYIDWGSQLDQLIEYVASDVQKAPPEVQVEILKALREITLGNHHPLE
jgi:hypothetical protein